MALELDPHQRRAARRRSGCSASSRAFQSVTPLTIGELWAWPSALKLALVEHLRASADVLAAEPRATVLAADRLADARRSTPAARATAWPADVHPAFVTRLLQRVARARRDRRRAAPTARRRAGGARPDGRGCDPRRKDSTRRPSRRSMANLDRQPAPDLDVRLERVLRERQPRRAGAAARSGRRLRPDGLPQPRPLPPCRRGAGGADRRGAAACSR